MRGSNTLKEYLILSNVCLDDMISNLINHMDYENACFMGREFTVVCGDWQDFLYAVYKCGSFPENEVLLKVDEILHYKDIATVVYVYCLKCREERITFKSGHSENVYIRNIKDYLREQKQDVWIHSTDTEKETRQLSYYLSKMSLLK